MRTTKAGRNRSAICTCLILAALALLLLTADAEEWTGWDEVNELSGELDAGGQWRYALVNGGAVITGYEGEPEGKLVIPDELDGYAVTVIWRCAFAWCEGLTSVTIPDSVTMIAEEAFVCCHGLTDVTIGSGVTRINGYAFGDCCSLTSVTIPDSVTSISVHAFSGCTGLTSVIIPDSVTSMSGNPFTDCRLTRIDVDPENPAFESIDGVLFDKQRKELVSCPGAKTGAYTIPEGTLLIDDLAFDSCEGLTAVKIPDSMTSIGADSFISNPFVDCPLVDIDVGSGNPTFECADGGLFDKQRKALVAYPASREGAYTVPEGTLLIGDYASIVATV